MIRMLIDDPWTSGGLGRSIHDVANMTPDQVWFSLCDRELLKRKPGKGRVKKVSNPALLKTNEQGFVKGRDAEGNVVWRPLMAEGGESLAGSLLKKRKKAKRK